MELPFFCICTAGFNGLVADERGYFQIWITGHGGGRLERTLERLAPVFSLSYARLCSCVDSICLDNQE